MTQRFVGAGLPRDGQLLAGSVFHRTGQRIRLPPGDLHPVSK